MSVNSHAVPSGRCRHLHDAADGTAIGKHVTVVVAPLSDVEAAARAIALQSKY